MIQGYQEEDKVLEFLVGLNESYASTRSQILMQDPLPNINKAYASVIQEESQRCLSIVPTENDKNGSSNGSGTSSNSGQFAGNIEPHRPKMVCTHCGITGHTMSKCFRIHEYPPGHKLHGKFLNRNDNRNTSNHTSSSGKPSAANFTTSSESSEGNNGDNIVGDQDLVASLIAVQCQRLMALLS
uniref:Uncharacterized protein n=1 Tax=Cannabis sativa TaxID=3483 RepID=A0A803PIQ8_CANSA